MYIKKIGPSEKTMLYKGYRIPQNLRRRGFDLDNEDNLDDNPFNMDVINEVRKIISTYFIPTENFTKISSYSLKHTVEGYLKRYVSNGELIFAMISEGYHFFPLGINCFFNVNKASVKAMISDTSNPYYK